MRKPGLLISLALLLGAILLAAIGLFLIAAGQVNQTELLAITGFLGLGTFHIPFDQWMGWGSGLGSLVLAFLLLLQAIKRLARLRFDLTE